MADNATAPASETLLNSSSSDVTSADTWTTSGLRLVLNLTASLTGVTTGSGGNVSLVTSAREMVTSQTPPGGSDGTEHAQTTLAPTLTPTRMMTSSLWTYFTNSKTSSTTSATTPVTELSSRLSSIVTSLPPLTPVHTTTRRVSDVIVTSAPRRQPAIGELLVVDEFNPWWSIRHDESIAMIVFAVVVMMVVVIIIILAHVVLRSRQGYERLSNNGDQMVVPVTPPHRYETVCRPLPDEEPEEGPRDGGFVGVTVPLVQEVTRI